MYNRILKRMCAKIRMRQYVMAIHAEEEMEADGLTILDVERVVLFGEIVERQKNDMPGQWKYRISEETAEGIAAEVVAKLGPTEKLVIITVYVE
jgi:hypothetical protein